MRGLGPFWRQTAKGARDRKCHPARANRRRAVPRMRARLSAAATGYQEGKQPPHPQRRATSPPHPISPPEFTDPRSTYRLRTSSGSEMAREASVGTRAGAVRAGILETAAETAAPAAEAALAFRAETNGEGRRAEAACTISAPTWGKAGRTIGREARPCAGR